MEKKNTGLKVLVVILTVLVLALGGFIFYDKVLSKDSKPDVNDNKTSIKLEESKDYVYDATYSYNNQYTEFELKDDYNNETKGTISYYGIDVEYTNGMQYLSNLKVPYLNIKNDRIKEINKELEKLYLDYAQQFDKCAATMKTEFSMGCTQILTYRTYTYNNLLSIVVIDSLQQTAPFILKYHSYTIDLNNGNLVSLNDLAEKLGYNTATLNNNIKTAINNKIDELWKDHIEGEDKLNSCYKKASDLFDSSINDNTVIYFADNAGYLNVFAVPYYDGVQNGEINKYLLKIDK